MSSNSDSNSLSWKLPHARRTKLIATLGPKHTESNALSQLIDGGAEIFRLNMSHATHDFVRQVTPKLRSLAANRGQEIAILLDTQGPAIRTGTIGQPRQLAVGDSLILSIDPKAPSPAIPVNYPDLIHDLQPGQKLLVDNGVIHLQVVKKDTTSLHCRVLTPGTLGDRRCNALSLRLCERVGLGANGAPAGDRVLFPAGGTGAHHTAGAAAAGVAHVLGSAGSGGRRPVHPTGAAGGHQRLAGHAGGTGHGPELRPGAARGPVGLVGFRRIARSRHRPGDGAGVSSKHVLALVNTGSATAADIVDMARLARSAVKDKFGIVLEPEVQFVGLSL